MFHSKTEDKIYQLGKALLLEPSQKKSTLSLFNKDWWYGQMIDWAMGHPQWKSNMFRFVDVFPYLKTGEDIIKHLKEYFEENGQLPPIFNFGLGMGKIVPELMHSTVKKNMLAMSKLFITGENIDASFKHIKAQYKKNIKSTIAILGEATLSEKEAQFFFESYKELITKLHEKNSQWNSQNFDKKIEPPKTSVSIKISSLYSQIKVEAWDETISCLKEKIRPLLLLAKEKNVLIYIDMEHFEYKDLTLKLFKDLLMEESLISYPFLGIVIQTYLKNSLKDLESLKKWAEKRKTPVFVRLVKGAYWDTEVINANQNSWPSPVLSEKILTDANCENCISFLLKNNKFLKLALGSHNARTIATAITLAEEMNLPKESLEFQMLYGMVDSLKQELTHRGFRVREYITIGDPIPSMAYLVRRLLENSANDSFLKKTLLQEDSLQNLLKSPHEKPQKNSSLNLLDKKIDPSVNPQINNSVSNQKYLFRNTPPLNFSIEENRSQFKSALDELVKQLPITASPMTSGSNTPQGKTVSCFNPGNTQEPLGTVHYASKKLVNTAVAKALQGSASWGHLKNREERIKLIKKVGTVLLENRFKLSSLIVKEVGKTWAESDAEVCEAIDFCFYYAEQYEKLQPQLVSNVLGEQSIYYFKPRGPTAVIAPWNFPLAILAGMSVAALVTGNPILIKPAEQSSLIAQEFIKILLTVGIPKNIVHFLPGLGEEIGKMLVQHKDITTIAFTGSKDVGLEIIETSGRIQKGQVETKRSVIEMGGKNGIIIDSDADLDHAIKGIIDSAFKFQGQKCSACSRVIVVDSIYKALVARLLPAIQSLKIKNPVSPEAFAGPLIDVHSINKVKQFIQRAKDRGVPCLLENKNIQEDFEKGYFISPIVFSPVDPQDELAQEEIFGPVLSLITVKTFDEALQVMNSTSFALTGGVYSRSPQNIKRAQTELNLGNIYVNRNITGALVGRHPFGGFKMSGVGSKAGGPDYIKQFMNSFTTTENMVRCGFSPDILN